MWVKICANTNLKDAEQAWRLGADAVGFVFAHSPRQVTAEQVADITRRLPKAIERIGVFDTLEIEEIADTIRIAGLTGAQLHGGYSPQLINVLARRFPSLRIIQTAHWNREGQAATSFSDQMAAFSVASGIDAVLIDSRTASASGGTGVVFDWRAAKDVLSGLHPRRLVVAGGLNAGNVRQAISTLNPWGVDVASGVEARPGYKDPAKLAEFLSNARATTPVRI